MRPYIKILSSINPLGWNCVLYARSRMPGLPFGLWTYADKVKIINHRKPEKGDIAIIKTNQIWGHVAVVTKIGSLHTTIQEGNWKTGKITERHDTPYALRITGYFRKEALDKKTGYATMLRST